MAGYWRSWFFFVHKHNSSVFVFSFQGADEIIFTLFFQEQLKDQ
jgi:hypothetical protein